MNAKLTPTKEEIAKYLEPLEGWKPTDEEKELAFEHIEWLDRAMKTLKPEDELWIRTLRRLSAICRRSFQLPSSMPVIDEDEVTRVGEVIMAGQASVVKGDWKGCAVALKVFDLSADEYKYAWKDCLDEVTLWRYTSPHPYIVPFLGKSNSASFCLVSEWMENGTVMNFLRSNPHEDRIPLIADTMTGIQFIHSLGIVHADLKSNNVLVDSQRRARIADFGISSTTSNTHTQATADRGTYHYKAPELSKHGSKPSEESDFFSLALLIWEMFSLEFPFAHHKNPYAIPQAIEGGERPPYPEGARDVGLTDKLWALLQRCWSKAPWDRRLAWKEMVEMFDIRSDGAVSKSQANRVARNIRIEDADGERVPTRDEKGVIYLSPWWEWPQTYGRDRSVFASVRPPPDNVIELHRLLDGLSLPKMIFDMSFFECRPLRKDPARSGYGLVPLFEEDLDAPASDADIKYIHVTCAAIPGWKAQIWTSKTVSTASTYWDLEGRPGTPIPTVDGQNGDTINTKAHPSIATVGGKDEVPSNLLCCLPGPTLPRWLSKTSPPEGKTDRPPSVRTVTPAPSVFADRYSLTGSITDPPSSAPLAAPVPDEGLPGLATVTVRDVLRWLYVDLHQPAPEEVNWLWSQERHDIEDAHRHRRKRPRDKALRAKLRANGRLTVDHLREEVMFDGFVPIMKNDTGGLEVELMLRKPTDEELEWLRDHQ